MAKEQKKTYANLIVRVVVDETDAPFDEVKFAHKVKCTLEHPKLISYYVGEAFEQNLAKGLM
jgi:hypothetical protein